MKKFKKELFRSSKGFRTTISLNNDIAIIKKINNLITKLERNGEDSKYKHEIINIFMVLKNLFNFNEDLKELIKYKFITDDNHILYEKLYFEFYNDLI